MGLPALLFSESWVPPAAPAVDPAVVEHLRSEYRELFSQVRRDPPTEGSPEEDAVLLRVSLLGVATYRAFGAAFVDLSRAGINDALTALLQKEMEEAEPKRKAALRYIEQAVHQYGVVTESYGAAFAKLGPSALAAVLEELERHATAGELPVTDEDRIVVRFQLDVMVALDVRDSSLEELTFWAFRALTNARRVEAMAAATLPRGMLGEVARLQAKRSWSNWDAAEMAKELAPWTSSR